MVYNVNMVTNDTASFLAIIEESVKHVQDAESHMAFLMRGGTTKGLFGALKYALEKRLYTLTPEEKTRVEGLYDAFVFTCGFWNGTVAKPIPKAAQNPFRTDKQGNVQSQYAAMMQQMMGNWGYRAPEDTEDDV